MTEARPNVSPEFATALWRELRGAGAKVSETTVRAAIEAAMRVNPESTCPTCGGRKSDR